jgi:hypothetical protein
MVSLICVFVGVLAASPPPQTSAIDVPPGDEMQEMVLHDGTRAIGRVQHVTDGVVAFRTISGELVEVETSRVVKIVAFESGGAKHAYRPADPSPTRLLLGPTGRSLKPREAYVDAEGPLFPHVQVGLTDRVSIGVGAPIFFTAVPVFWVTPKVQVFAGQKTEAAVGVMHVDFVGHESLGIVYGVVTRGTLDAAVTAGLGYSYAWGEHSGAGAPVVMVGGEKRVSSRVKLLTENCAFRGGGMMNGGVRMMFSKRAIDMGLASPIGAGRFFLFPTIRLVRKF